MRVGIIGANGQLGTDLVRSFSHHKVLAWTRSDFDVRDERVTAEVIGRAHPDVVINTAAFHRVDACEDDIQTAFAVNAVGAHNVTRSCAACGAALVHISTDYVFGGGKEGPYTEDDPPLPVNVYGAAKLAGEHLVANGTKRYYIVRVASLFGLAGASGKGGNFVETILAKASRGETLRVVDDIIMSPTYTRDAADLIRRLVEHPPASSGIYHITNAGACTWFAFAEEIVRQTRSPVPVTPISSKTQPSKARRPSSSALISTHLPPGFPVLRPWPAALADYLEARARHVPA